MEHYPYQKILRATPDGVISKFDSRAMHAMVAASRSEAEKTSNAVRAAKILMGAAREAMANGYLAVARSLYIDAMYRIREYADRTYSHAGCELHYRCAIAVDRIERRVSGRAPKVPMSACVKAFYMSLAADYEYSVLNIDNDARFNRYKEYCERHGIG